MLESKEPMATVAVSKLERARKFYEDKVGLTPTSEQEEEGVIAYKCGKASLFVYESEYAGTNEATAVTWTVGDDIQKIVRDLAKNGVAFENYDMPDAKKEGDVFVFGKIKTAWFKDPDGNIHALVNG
jgi:catechol 2,3-dioxygenase-like lactoylglutathione lyase family enzyme